VAAKGAASSSNDYVEQLLLEMVAHMLSHEDFEALLTWMRDSAQRFFGHMDFVDEGGPRALAAMVARSAWNRMPLPGNHFKPRPVPTPGRNDSCPCNSGAKYKHCCAELPSFESFSADDIWTAVAIQLPAAQLRVAIETKRMPPIALAEAARRELLAAFCARAGSAEVAERPIARGWNRSLRSGSASSVLGPRSSARGAVGRLMDVDY